LVVFLIRDNLGKKGEEEDEKKKEANEFVANTNIMPGYERTQRCESHSKK